MNEWSAVTAAIITGGLAVVTVAVAAVLKWGGKECNSQTTTVALKNSKSLEDIQKMLHNELDIRKQVAEHGETLAVLKTKVPEIAEKVNNVERSITSLSTELRGWMRQNGNFTR